MLFHGCFLLLSICMQSSSNKYQTPTKNIIITRCKKMCAQKPVLINSSYRERIREQSDVDVVKKITLKRTVNDCRFS